MHSEGILSGELKHGPLALIDENMPIIMVAVKDHTYEKCLNAVQQVSARAVRSIWISWKKFNAIFQGKPIMICEEECVDDVSRFSSNVLTIPKTVDCLSGILTVIPLQLMSFHLAVERGCNVSWPEWFPRIFMVILGWFSPKLGQICDGGVMFIFQTIQSYVQFTEFAFFRKNKVAFYSNSIIPNRDLRDPNGEFFILCFSCIRCFLF